MFVRHCNNAVTLLPCCISHLDIAIVQKVTRASSIIIFVTNWLGSPSSTIPLPTRVYMREGWEHEQCIFRFKRTNQFNINVYTLHFWGNKFVSKSFDDSTLPFLLIGWNGLLLPKTNSPSKETKSKNISSYNKMSGMWHVWWRLTLVLVLGGRWHLTYDLSTNGQL